MLQYNIPIILPFSLDRKYKYSNRYIFFYIKLLCPIFYWIKVENQI